TLYDLDHQLVAVPSDGEAQSGAHSGNRLASAISVLLGSVPAGGLKLSVHPRLSRTLRFRCRSPQTCRHCSSRRSEGVCHARQSHLRAEQTPLCCSAAAALAYSFSRFGPSVALSSKDEAERIETQESLFQFDWEA